MKFLKKLHELKQDSKDLVLLLDSAVGGMQSPRGTNPLHASEVTSEYYQFCPREILLLDVTKKKRPDKYISPPMQVAFDVGEAIHTLVREKWLREYVVGNWRCIACNHTIEFSKYPKVPCPVCQHKDYAYKELVCISKEYGMSGSLDMIVDFKAPKHTMVEIKSIDKDQFEELHAPLAEHRVRTNLYLNLIEKSGSPYMDRIDTEQAKILYVSKAYGKKHPTHGMISPFKEFTIVRSEASSEFYFKLAAQVVAYRKSHENFTHLKMDENGLHPHIPLPPRICSTPLANRSKQCSCNKECWSVFVNDGVSA